MACCKCSCEGLGVDGEMYKWEDPQEPVYKDPEDNKEYCIFHAPKDCKFKKLGEENIISVEDFNKKVFERINNVVDDTKSPWSCNLSFTVFPDKISFSQYGIKEILPSISFYKSTFYGIANYRGLSFNGEVDFENVNFKKEAVFTNVIFDEKAVFMDAIFDEGAGFLKAVFDGEAYFGRTTFSSMFANFIGVVFNKGANFHAVTFNSSALFTKVKFNGNAIFSRAKIKEGIGKFDEAFFSNTSDFSLAQFEDGAMNFTGCNFIGDSKFSGAVFSYGANFNTASFSKEAWFDQSKFAGKASFVRTVFNGYAGFMATIFESEVRFTHSVFNDVAKFSELIIGSEGTWLDFESCYADPIKKMYFENLDMESFVFFNTDMTNLQFVNCTWPLEENRYCIQSEKDENYLESVRDFYQRMKRKLKDEHNEYEASKWHIAEKEAHLKILKQKNESRFIRSALWIYKQLSGFGENPFRAGWVLAAVMLIVLVLLGLGGIVKGDKDLIIQGIAYPSWGNIENFGTVFITFFKNVMLFKATTIEFKPQYGFVNGVILILTRLIIPLQAALFAFALRNRFRR